MVWNHHFKFPEAESVCGCVGALEEGYLQTSHGFMRGCKMYGFCRVVVTCKCVPCERGNRHIAMPSTSQLEYQHSTQISDNPSGDR